MKTSPQAPEAETSTSATATQSPAIGPLLSFAVFCQALKVCERKGHELLAAGVIPQPLVLGPRCHRWTPEDFQLTLQRLSRRQRTSEPTTLAAGRRKRIEALKLADKTDAQLVQMSVSPMVRKVPNEQG